MCGKSGNILCRSGWFPGPYMIQDLWSIISIFEIRSLRKLGRQVEPRHNNVLANKGFTHCAERSSKCRAPQNGKCLLNWKIGLQSHLISNWQPYYLISNTQKWLQWFLMKFTRQFSIWSRLRGAAGYSDWFDFIINKIILKPVTSSRLQL